MALQFQSFDSGNEADAHIVGSASMHVYRAYLIGMDGHILERIDIKAQSLVKAHDVELWDRVTKIAR